MSLEYSAQRLAALADERITLTAEQAAIIGSPLDSGLVVAGAGAGKTLVMALRVAYLVANRLVRPESVLGLTFTRKAAGELSERVRDVLDKVRSELPAKARREDSWLGEDALSPVVSTYDAYASDLVRSYGLLVGADPDASILSQAQRWQLASEVVESAADFPDVDVSAGRLVKLLLAVADQTTDNQVAPDLLVGYLDWVANDLGSKAPAVNPDTGRLKKAKPQGITEVIRTLRTRQAAATLIDRYRLRKLESGVMDFVDRADWARRLARLEPVATAERARFQAVVLDEFQDTSTSQIDLLSALFSRTPVMAVGDPNQSIYGWRGASAAALTVFDARFGERAAAVAAPEPSYLTVARRNDLAILAVANTISEPLRHDLTAPVPELKARSDAGEGRVDSVYCASRAEEVQAVVAYLKEHWEPWLGAQEPREAAILVRTRRELPSLVAALQAAGLDYQVIGRGGLLQEPEVQDVVSALTASQDLGRGDAFMRLAASPRFALGIADLDRLASLVHSQSTASSAGATEPAGPHPHATATEPPGPQLSGSDERQSVLDVLEDIVMEASPDAKLERLGGISAVGLARLRRIGRILRRLRRAAAYLSLPELVLEAEKALGLDVDLMSGSNPAGRAQIDQLVGQAHDYSRGQDQVSLTGFLGWLEAEDEAGGGLDLADVPTPSGAVQLLTIHGAKGLEWDVVCVTGLVEEGFPKVSMVGEETEREPSALGWLSDATTGGASGGLPWPLRRDRQALPHFEHAGGGYGEELAALIRDLPDRPPAPTGGTEDVLQLAHNFGDFKRRAGLHHLAEERRLAYVAVTRAKSHLLLSGSWTKPAAKGSKPPSLFLEELAEVGLVDRSGWADGPATVGTEAGSDAATCNDTAASGDAAEARGTAAAWDGAEGRDGAAGRAPGTDEDQATQPTGEGSGQFPLWPAPHPAGGREGALEAAARAVATAQAQLGPISPSEGIALFESMGSDLADRAALLIREREQEQAVRTVAPPAQTSATALIALAEQGPEAVRALRRPVPVEPSRGAALGEEFHRRAALELASLDGSSPRQEMLDADLLAARHIDSATEAQLESLMRRFRQSRWMNLADSSVTVESELETELIGRAVVARIDAVIRDRQGRLTVVDWKTGRSSHGHAHQLHGEQVKLYQAVLAQQEGLPPDRIGGYVHYVMENLSVPVVCPPQYLDQLVARLASASHA
ncbi:MAG: ATP-dependent helicase [Bifidobacteriaceae bacterium]|jgi:DNA helicase-2/ATP-dependent DNA helicase PcrA|nr:ATP-dependent helicase [Bifidobacteriaceae bacterium]